MTSTQADDLHRALLHASGRVPDALIARARRWLAEGRVDEVADVLTLAAPPPGALPYLFAPSERPGPYSLDLTAEAKDPLDAAAVRGAARAGATALWRSWRHPAVPSCFPPPKRVYLLQTAGDEVAAAVAVQDALENAGEADPLVEVFTGLPQGLVSQGLPALQGMALASSALLWTAEPTPALILAPTFDVLDDRGWPAFGDGRPILDADEAPAVVAYLEAGAIVLATPELADDVLDPGGAGVPMGIRGDGVRLWSEAVAHYAREYGIAPDARLLAAIRENGYAPPVVSTAALHRAVSFVYAAVEADTVESDAVETDAVETDAVETDAMETAETEEDAKER